MYPQIKSVLHTSNAIVKSQIIKLFDKFNCLSIYSYTDFISLLKELKFINSHINRHEQTAITDIWKELTQNSCDSYVSSSMIKSKLVEIIATNSNKSKSKYAIFFINRQTQSRDKENQADEAQKQRKCSSHRINELMNKDSKLHDKAERLMLLKSQREIEECTFNPDLSATSHRNKDTNKDNLEKKILMCNRWLHSSMGQSMNISEDTVNVRGKAKAKRDCKSKESVHAPLLKINLYGN